MSLLQAGKGEQWETSPGALGSAGSRAGSCAGGTHRGHGRERLSGHRAGEQGLRGRTGLDGHRIGVAVGWVVLEGGLAAAMPVPTVPVEEDPGSAIHV